MVVNNPLIKALFPGRGGVVGIGGGAPLNSHENIDFEM